eukprot:2262024-Rhodomonas_salina.1
MGASGTDIGALLPTTSVARRMVVRRQYVGAGRSALQPEPEPDRSDDAVRGGSTRKAAPAPGARVDAESNVIPASDAGDRQAGPPASPGIKGQGRRGSGRAEPRARQEEDAGGVQAVRSGDEDEAQREELNEEVEEATEEGYYSEEEFEEGGKHTQEDS